jgi:lysozyme
VTGLLIPDVSNFQGQVDWPAVLASGRVGGICKATEGLGYVDRTFSANWNTLGALGAIRGAYHFARPDNDPAGQAEKFLSVVKNWKADDLLVLDLEVGTGNLDRFALGWLTQVETRTGIKPWLYSYGPFIRAHLADRRLAGYPLWIAAYQPNPPPPAPPWTSWTLWQHTDKANIAGIHTLCDESTGTLPDRPTPAVQPKVAPMYNPPLGPIAAVWQNPDGSVIAGISPDGDVYAWGCKWAGNVSGKPYWGNRKVASIGARPDGQPGYLVVPTSGEPGYNLPDGLDQL